MQLQVFDVDKLFTYDFEVDENGDPTGKVTPCNNPYCSYGHLFGLYKDGVWQGHDLKDIIYDEQGNPSLKKNESKTEEGV